MKGVGHMKNEPAMIENGGYIGVKEVMSITGASRASAYAVLAKLNTELSQKGFLTFSGRVPRRYFLKRTGLEKG